MDPNPYQSPKAENEAPKPFPWLSALGEAFLLVVVGVTVAFAFVLAVAVIFLGAAAWLGGAWS